MFKRLFMVFAIGAIALEFSPFVGQIFPGLSEGSKIRLWTVLEKNILVTTLVSGVVFFLMCFIIRILYKKAGAKKLKKKFIAANMMAMGTIAVLVIEITNIYGLRLNHIVPMVLFLIAITLTTIICSVSVYFMMITLVAQTREMRYEEERPAKNATITLLGIIMIFTLTALMDYILSDISKSVMFIFPDFSFISIISSEHSLSDLAWALKTTVSGIIMLMLYFGTIFYIAFSRGIKQHLNFFFPMIFLVSIIIISMFVLQLSVCSYVNNVFALPFPNNNIVVFLILCIECLMVATLSSNSIMEVDFETVDETTDGINKNDDKPQEQNQETQDDWTKAEPVD